MGVIGIMSSQKSLKTITLDKNRLKQEMKLHTGRGINGGCTYDDVAEILGYANGKTIINKNYTFSETEINKLCSAWGVRVEYLQGFDEWRTDFEYNDLLFEEEQQLNSFRRDFLSSLDIAYSYSILCPCLQEQWVKDFSQYKYFFDEQKNIYYIVLENAEMLETFYLNYNLRFKGYYLFTNTNNEIVNIIDSDVFAEIMDILRENAIKGLLDLLSIAPKPFLHLDILDSLSFKKLFVEK